MATTKPYTPRIKHIARVCAAFYLEKMELCPCAVNRAKVERIILPILEMFEEDIGATGEIGEQFAVAHLGFYFRRMDEEMAKGLHKSGESAKAGSHDKAGGKHGFQQ